MTNVAAIAPTKLHSATQIRGMMLVNCYGRWCKQPRSNDPTTLKEKGHIDNDISVGGFLEPPSRCIEFPPWEPSGDDAAYPKAGGGVVMESYLSKIPPGREGYVYLVHAEGTDRYKIGRSVNPITRIQELQKQSPYPLRLIRTSWSLDAIADEAWLHEHFKDCRIFGEWFEFKQASDGSRNKKLKNFNSKILFPPTKIDIAIEAIYELCKLLKIDFNIFGEHFIACDIILDLYYDAMNRYEIVAIESFLQESLPSMVYTVFKEKLSISKTCGSENAHLALDSFMDGCLKTFALLVLKKQV